MSRRTFVVWGVSLLVGACGFTGKGSEASDATIDAQRIDATVDGPPTATCIPWTPIEPTIDPCAGLGAPTPLALTSGNASFDTGTGVLDRGGGNTATLPGILLDRVGTGYPSLRVVNLESLHVDDGRTLSIVGPHAVLFLVHGAATLGGNINASAAVPDGTGTKAAGADSPRCDATRAGGTGTAADADNRGGGGGGGGGLGDNGGLGGVGYDDRTGGTRGATDSENIPLRGGCPGGRGGDNDVAGTNQGGLGGGGGGAFAISARGAITVVTTARLSANGAPGLGASLPRAGGGGGGAGGTIALDGATVTVQGSAQLCAKGGGGGEGSSSQNDGGSGSTADCSTARAPGGSGGTTTAGNGGGGGTRGNTEGQMGGLGIQFMGVQGGGGGGGGGVGKILLRSRPAGGVTVGSAIVSPTHTIL